MNRFLACLLACLLASPWITGWLAGWPSQSKAKNGFERKVNHEAKQPDDEVYKLKSTLQHKSIDFWRSHPSAEGSETLLEKNTYHYACCLWYV